MTTDFLRGFNYAFSGLRWISHRRLRVFVLVPLVINIVLFATAIVWGGRRFDTMMDNLLVRLPEWLGWLAWLAWLLFALAVVLIGFYAFTLVANLIGAPFNGLLSERVEELTRGSVSESPHSLWREIVAAPVGEIKKLAYFVLWAIPMLVVFVIPVIQVAAPAIWFVFMSWMLALEYADYPLGNRGLRFSSQRRCLGRHRGIALGFGTGMTVLTLVPVLNFVAMPAGVIGATLLATNEMDDCRDQEL